MKYDFSDPMPCGSARPEGWLTDPGSQIHWAALQKHLPAEGLTAWNLSFDRLGRIWRPVFKSPLHYQTLFDPEGWLHTSDVRRLENDTLPWPYIEDLLGAHQAFCIFTQGSQPRSEPRWFHFDPGVLEAIHEKRRKAKAKWDADKALQARRPSWAQR